METDDFKTDVCFRKFDDGDIIALFPYEIADSDGNIMSYMLDCQYGPAYYQLTNSTKPAKESEYNDLKAELESLGYNLHIIKHISWLKYREALNKPLPDFKYKDSCSIISLFPQNHKAWVWVKWNIPVDSTRDVRAVYIELQYFANIGDRIFKEGLTMEKI
jgi:hypothetical protein